MQTDVELWDLMQKGDDTAFSRIYYAHIDALYAYGVHVGFGTDDVQDAIHDLFVKLHGNRGKYFGVTNIKSYLFIALKNTLLNFKPKAELIPLIQEEHDSESDSIEELWIQGEKDAADQEKIKELLNQLTPRQREVIYFRYFKTMSFKEIAEQLKINPQSAKNIAHEAMRKIKGLLTLLLSMLFFMALLWFF